MFHIDSTMKSWVLISLALTCLAGVLTEEAPDLEKKYANFDIEAVLKSKRLVNNYVNCLIDKGPCSPEGTDLKKTLPSTLQSLCEKCTPSQVDKTISVIKRVKKDYPEEWKVLLQKWDPTGEYKKKFEAKYGKKLDE